MELQLKSARLVELDAALNLGGRCSGPPPPHKGAAMGIRLAVTARPRPPPCVLQQKSRFRPPNREKPIALFFDRM